MYLQDERNQGKDRGAQADHNHRPEPRGLTAVLAFESNRAANGKRHEDSQSKFVIYFYFHAEMFAWKLGRIRYSFLTFPLPVETLLTLLGFPLYSTVPLPVIWASISSLAAISTSPEPVIRISATRVLKLLPCSFPEPLKLISAVSVDPLTFTLPEPETVISASRMEPRASSRSPEPLQTPSSSAHL